MRKKKVFFFLMFSLCLSTIKIKKRTEAGMPIVEQTQRRVSEFYHTRNLPYDAPDDRASFSRG